MVKVMLTINWKQIYEVSLNETKQWVLIIYDISQNHYVGIPVYNENRDNSIYLKSINKYIELSETAILISPLLFIKL